MAMMVCLGRRRGPADTEPCLLVTFAARTDLGMHGSVSGRSRIRNRRSVESEPRTTSYIFSGGRGKRDLVVVTRTIAIVVDFQSESNTSAAAERSAFLNDASLLVCVGLPRDLVGACDGAWRAI